MLERIQQKQHKMILFAVIAYGIERSPPLWIGRHLKRLKKLANKYQEKYMSLDVSLKIVKPVTVFDANITHNLIPMAKEAGIYCHRWRPEELDITKAGELIKPLEDALTAMIREPDRFRQHDPPNGWGNFDIFRAWVEQYLEACRKYPDAIISISR